jgi:hypothetical protein
MQQRIRDRVFIKRTMFAPDDPRSIARHLASMEPPPTHELVLLQKCDSKNIELYNAILPQQTCYNSSTFSPSLEAYSASSRFTSARTLSY